jgi:hypothetical protein
VWLLAAAEVVLVDMVSSSGSDARIRRKRLTGKEKTSGDGGRRDGELGEGVWMGKEFGDEMTESDGLGKG